MTDIQIAIEGQTTPTATQSLLAIPGIEGNWETEEITERGEPLTTIATIVAIVGGTVAIAEQICKWYVEYRQRNQIEKVLIIGRNGERILLENATVEQIKQILES